MQEKRTIKTTDEDYLNYYYDVPYDGKTSAGRPLRKLKDITCPYRGIKMISSDCIKGFEKGITKCENVEDFVILLSRYYDNMLPVEKSVFAIFKDFIKLNENDTLQNCLKMLETTSMTKLKLEEFEVLDMVDALTRKLSPQTALDVREKTTKCRQIIISNNKCDTFKRKTFLKSLDEICFKENEREIICNIRNKALFLPTSESSLNAFVVKYSRRKETEIARRLFIASTTSIEHIIPASLGGVNSIGNFLLTSASGNRYRENMPLVEYIKRFPKIPTYMQIYIDDIINAIHNGELAGNETYPYKIKKKLMKASEGRIMISLSKYKYSENEAVEAVKEYEQMWINFNK